MVKVTTHLTLFMLITDKNTININYLSFECMEYNPFKPNYIKNSCYNSLLRL